MKKTVLYHVTKTSSVSKIRKLGIMPTRRSNWVVLGTGRRYGKRGEIFAFERHGDALQWAGRFDWELHHDLGTEKVSIVEFFANLADWSEDTADPLSHAGSEGRWLKSTTSVKPGDIFSVTPVTEAQIRERIRQRDSR